MPVLDCHSRAEDPVARGLSNFAARAFTLHDWMYASMEGFLQSLKFINLEQRNEVATLAGYRAFRFGQDGNDWKDSQMITQIRDGIVSAIPRDSRQYQELLIEAYDAQFDQSRDFRGFLRRSVGFTLRHTMGKHDSRDTLLTESEYIRQLERLRWRALDELEKYDE